MTDVPNFEFAGFLPEGEWERAVCDSILVTLNDLLTTVARDTYVYTLYKFDVRIITYIKSH